MPLPKVQHDRVAKGNETTTPPPALPQIHLGPAFNVAQEFTAEETSAVPGFEGYLPRSRDAPRSRASNKLSKPRGALDSLPPPKSRALVPDIAFDFKAQDPVSPASPAGPTDGFLGPCQFPSRSRSVASRGRSGSSASAARSQSVPTPSSGRERSRSVFDSFTAVDGQLTRQLNSPKELRAVRAEVAAQEGHVRATIAQLQSLQEEVRGKDLGVLWSPTSPLLSPKEATFERRMSQIQSRKELERLDIELSVAKRQEARVQKMKDQTNKLLESRGGVWLVLHCLSTSITQWQFLHRSRHARGVIWRLLLPRWRLRVRLRRLRVARRLLTQACLPAMSRPTVAELRGTALFGKWPPSVLERIARAVTPVAFRPGEFVISQGDPGFVMYIIDHGCLEVLVRNDADGKRRAPGIKVATLGARGVYCGEFTLLVGEPRAASLRATETTCLWALHRATLQFWSAKLPPALQTEAREVAAERRRQNLYKLYPLTPDCIRSTALFRSWGVQDCEALAAKCKPMVFNAGEAMVREGAAGDAMYFLAHGKAHVFYGHGSTAEERAGAVHAPGVVGEIALLYSEARTATVVAGTNVECWALPVGAFHDLKLSHPAWFLQAKATVNEQRAARLRPPPPSSLLESPLLPRGFRTADWGQRLVGVMRPRVCDATSPVTEAQTPVQEVVVCLRGALEDAARQVRFAEGAVVGAEEFVGGRLWPYSLKARSRVDLWVLDVDAFGRFLKCNEALAAAFVRSAPADAAQRFGLAPRGTPREGAGAPSRTAGRRVSSERPRRSSARPP